MSGGWSWLNHHHLTDALKRITQDDTRELVIDALEAVLESPFDPPSVDVHQMHGRPPLSQERWIAWLPAGWYLVYRPYKQGPFPYPGPHVVVLAMRHLDEP